MIGSRGEQQSEKEDRGDDRQHLREGVAVPHRDVVEFQQHHGHYEYYQSGEQELIEHQAGQHSKDEDHA